MHQIIVVVFMALVCAVVCKPLDVELNDIETKDVQHHTLWKRFVNPMFALGGVTGRGVSNMRTKRQAGDECQKLFLCKLHARSQRNFVAAFQLYFVNKENARLWDHQTRSIADCEARYGGCYDK